jgi:transposase
MNSSASISRPDSASDPSHSSPEHPPGRVVGLDNHPDLFSAGILEGHHALHARIVGGCDRQPIDELEAWATRHLNPSDLIVCEASSNSFEIITRLTALGFTAICLESQRVGQIRDSHYNDDRSSAERIARIYLSGLAKVVWVPDERTRTYRELLGAHQSAVVHATRTKNELRAYLTEHNIRLPKGTRLTRSETETKILESYSWDETQQLLVQGYCEAVRQAEERRLALRRTMARIICEDERMLRLMKILGIREVVAFALVAAIGDVDRFASPKKLAAFLGVVMRRDKSGTSIDKKRGCGSGRKDMRGLLVQSAQAILNSRKGGALREWGWRVFARRGNRNIAIIAVARKLATQAWYELKGKAPAYREASTLLRVKFTNLLSCLEKEEVKQLGFATKKEYAEFLLQTHAVENST